MRLAGFTKPSGPAGPDLGPKIQAAIGKAIHDAGASNTEAVVEGNITEADRPAIQTVIDSYTFDPNWGVPTEQQRLRNVVATLRQWATDAQTEANAWAGQSAAQRDNAMKQTFQRLGTLMDRLADVVQTGGWNS